MTKSLFLSALLIALSAQANWDGNWSGLVDVSNEPGQATERLENSISISEEGAEIKLTESLWGRSYTFTNYDGVLFMGEMYVGTITADELDVKFEEASDTDDICNQMFKITQVGSDLDYFDEYLCQGGYYERTTGTLNPARSSN